METYLCLDFGGTKLLVGEVDKYGNILRHKKYVSGYVNQPAAVEIMKNSVRDYLSTVGWATGKPAVAMGVGMIGRVDSGSGIWHQIDPHRSGQISLAREFELEFGLHCTIDNDVKSATRAERVWGVGRISNNYIYINVGTGIAAGTVVNGHQVRGSHFNAGEVGHTRVGVNTGIICPCGRVDCIERIASGSGLDASARYLRDKYPTALQFPDDKDTRIDVRDIFYLSRKGDPLCTVLVENAAEGLANLIMNLVRVSDPDTIVLGGGIVSDGYMLEKIHSYLNPQTMRFVSNGVVLTKLNSDFVGLLGAAAVAMEGSKTLVTA